MTCLRAKASSCAVKSRARSPASLDLLDVLGIDGPTLLLGLANALRAAQDHGEQVVEVVGHAAGQTPDALQLLPLAELIL